MAKTIWNSVVFPWRCWPISNHSNQKNSSVISNVKRPQPRFINFTEPSLTPTARGFQSGEKIFFSEIASLKTLISLRALLCTLATSRKPCWITEDHVTKEPNWSRLWTSTLSGTQPHFTILFQLLFISLFIYLFICLSKLAEIKTTTDISEILLIISLCVLWQFFKIFLLSLRCF